MMHIMNITINFMLRIKRFTLKYFLFQPTHEDRFPWFVIRDFAEFHEPIKQRNAFEMKFFLHNNTRMS